MSLSKPHLVAAASSLLLVLGPTGTSAANGTSALPPGRDQDQVLRNELQRAAGGHAQIADSRANGAVTFIGGSRVHPLAPSDDREPSQIARGFIDHYGSLFGVANPTIDLTELAVFKGGGGNTAVRYQQQYRGIHHRSTQTET